MFELFLLSLNCATALVILFKTSAIPQYLSIFGNFLNSRDYLAAKYLPGHRPTFFKFVLESRRPRLIWKLLSCDICLSVWISFFLCLLWGNLWFWGGTFIIGVTIYRIFAALIEITSEK